MREEREILISEGRVEIKKIDLIKALDKYSSHSIPAGIYVDWYHENYNEGDGTVQFSKFGFENSQTKLHTHRHEDTQITLGVDYQLKEIPVVTITYRFNDPETRVAANVHTAQSRLNGAVSTGKSVSGVYSVYSLFPQLHTICNR